MSETNGTPIRISRRDFARRAAFAAATAACLPGDLLASSAAPTPTAPQQENEKLSPESQAEVDAKIQAIFSKYGGRFSDAQKADIRRLVTEGQKPLEVMRKFPLDDSDQPATVLKLYPDATVARRASSR
jgi:nitrous oxide reductase